MSIVHTYNKVNSTNDALNARSIKYITDDIEALISMGVSPKKLIIALPFDSPKFVTTLSTSEIQFNETIDYNQICRLLSSGKGKKWQKSFDDNTGLAIAQNKEYQNDEIYSVVFESSRSIVNKLRKAIKYELAGAISDLLHKDDVHGKCGSETDTWKDFKPVYGILLEFPERNSTSFPLIKTINEAIALTLDEINQENYLNNDEFSNMPKIVLTLVVIIIVLIVFIILFIKWKKLRFPITFCSCAQCFRAKTLNYNFYMDSSNENKNQTLTR